MHPGTHLTLEEDFRIQLQNYAHFHDPVTGLANHILFRVSLRQMLSAAIADGEEIAFLWVDVLNLRREYSINGDEGVMRMVCMLADSLRPSVEPDELICRFSDRCFLLALKRDDNTGARLNAILQAASHRQLLGSEGKPELSAGVAYFPEHTNTAEDLIRFASLAAVSASRSRNREPVTFTPNMNSALLHERDLERDLRDAIKTGQLTLAYQPQVDLATGNIVGAECLTRWNHPVRGHVSPAQFIAVAEHSDLIDEIFNHSLHRLLSDVAAWRTEGVVLPLIAVNASPANVRHQDFVEIVKSELDLNPPGETQLDVEVTESLLMDDEDLFIERLNAVRSIGVQVSLDDFGTRYTGFNALQGLPLNTMKIDKCFIHGIDRSSQAQSLCRTMVTMATHLNLATVAEGIENPGELRILKELGCLAGQGYLFQRPVPSDQFLGFMREWPERKSNSEFASAFLSSDGNRSLDLDPLVGAA